MKKPVILGCFILFVCGVLSGCYPVKSLHPLYTEKELIFETKLLGTWMGSMGGEKDKTVILNFAEGQNKSYNLLYISEGNTCGLTANLVQLGKYRFLDIALNAESTSADKDKFRSFNQGYFAHIIYMHSFSKFIMEGESLSLEMLSHDFVKEKIEKNLIKLKNEVYKEAGEKEYIITANTAELQEFLIDYTDKYGSEGPAFFPKFELKKQK